MLDSSHRPRRRTALIDLELEKVKVGITALQEVRLSGEGHVREVGRTFYWKGRPTGEPRTAGVAFAIENSLAMKLSESPKGISERIMTLRISMDNNNHVTLINVYAPTMTYPDEEKEAFYEQLREVLNSVPAADKVILLGDFNARVGSDSDIWSGAIGKFGRGNHNSNGELLLCLCTELDLAVTNTYFQQPDRHYYSWNHPRSKRPHLLDYIIIRRKDLKDATVTRAMRGPDCDTDHQLIRTTFKFPIKPLYSKSEAPRKKKLDTAQLKDETCQKDLERAINLAVDRAEEEITPEEAWKSLSKQMYKAAAETIGFTRRRNADWFNENNEEIKEVLKRRNCALQAKLSNPSQENQERLRRARAEAQGKLREMENQWWLQKAQELQEKADESNSAGFLNSLKEVHGPQPKMSDTLLAADGSSQITEPKGIIGRWKDYFVELLNVEATVDDSVLNELPPYPVHSHMDVSPSIEEVKLAIEKSKCNKSPGIDGIPAEIYKFGGPKLTERLHRLIGDCWQQRTLPQDFKDVLIIPIYKNKGDHKDCGNYRGISLLSIAGKIMGKVIQSRLSEIAESVLTESQCGFRQNRSTIDMVFSLRQIQEKAIEQRRELYMVFVDFRKAFDTVDRRLLWKVLQRFGCPDHLVEMIKLFHDGMGGRVVVGGQETERFNITHGTKQGCVLAPTLFSLFLTVVLLIMNREIEDGIFINTRSDGQLFRLSRLRAKTKTRRELVTELLFADDTALVAHDEEQLQNMVNVFAGTARKIGLQVNTQKTEVLYQPSPENTNPTPPRIVIDGEPLKVVENFKYLGSTVTIDNRADKEISCRIQNACASYGKLESKLWKRAGIRLATKCKVYKAVVLPALLYSAETYTLYRGQIARLEAIQQRHLRKIMKIKWDDYVPNVEVLRRAGLESVEATLAASQLRWTGHVVRMDDSRIPKALLYGELVNGRRRVGGQKLRYRDVMKRHLKAMDIPTDNWEELARDRSKWRSAIHAGRAKIERRIIDASALRHHRRHNPGTYQCGPCGRLFHTERGLQQHRRMMHRPPTSHLQQ